MFNFGKRRARAERVDCMINQSTDLCFTSVSQDLGQIWVPIQFDPLKKTKIKER